MNSAAVKIWSSLPPLPPPLSLLLFLGSSSYARSDCSLSPSLTGLRRHACNACSSTSVLLTFLPIQRNAAPLSSPLLCSPALPPPLSCERSPPAPHSPSYYSLFSPSAALILRIKESHFIEEGEPALHFSFFLLFFLSQLALIPIYNQQPVLHRFSSIFLSLFHHPLLPLTLHFPYFLSFSPLLMSFSPHLKVECSHFGSTLSPFMSSLRLLLSDMQDTVFFLFVSFV